LIYGDIKKTAQDLSAPQTERPYLHSTFYILHFTSNSQHATPYCRLQDRWSL